jgi:hypothetical protein
MSFIQTNVKVQNPNAKPGSNERMPKWLIDNLSLFEL